MNQNIFETRQRAAELLEEAVKIWQRSDRSDNLEGLENDPVFKLLLSAMAYQANEQESELEGLKEDILKEFESMLVMEGAGRAVPTVLAISAPLSSGTHTYTVNSKDDFIVSGKDDNMFHFSPIFKTRLINSSVRSVMRLDMRRWEVTIQFSEAVSNLSGFAFAISDYAFWSLKVSLSATGEEIPMSAPWNYINYPMASHFSLDTLFYNKIQSLEIGGARSTFIPYSNYAALDLFAGMKLGFFVIDTMHDIVPASTLKLVFEFDGINNDFTFSQDDLFLNTIVLANAYKQSTSVSTSHPIAKLIGGNGAETDNAQFMYLLCPADRDITFDSHLHVRQIRAERFNKGRLLKLLHSLVAKYHSDYYAFESLGFDTTDTAMKQIQNALDSLVDNFMRKNDSVTPGEYVILANRNPEKEQFQTTKQLALNVDYLVTNGAKANDCLCATSTLKVSQYFDAKRVAIIDSAEGFDQVSDKNREKTLAEYFLSTGDRIVTPYDMKLFCYGQLVARYGMVRSMIDDVTVRMQENSQGGFHRYEAVVTITMKASDFTQRAFGEKTAAIESALSKMIFMRSNGLYPTRVKMIIN